MPSLSPYATLFVLFALLPTACTDSSSTTGGKDMPSVSAGSEKRPSIAWTALLADGPPASKKGVTRKKETGKKEPEKKGPKVDPDDALFKQEVERLKKLETSVALLEEEDKAMLQKIKKKVSDCDTDVDDKGIAFMKAHTKYFNVVELKRFWIARADNDPLTKNLVATLKLKDEIEIIKFKIAFILQPAPNRLAINFAIQQAAKDGLSSLPPETKQLLRQYAEWLGALPN